MAAVVEVALDVRVTVKLEAEHATPAELAELVKRDGGTVLGAILRRLPRRWPSDTEAGWLDENRAAFVTEVVDAHAIAWAMPEVTA